MKIARELKQTNIAEYLLYMWQLEDTLRAFNLDADRLQNEYVARFGWTDEEKRAESEWLSNLCIMMRQEGKQEHGHLQMNTGTLLMLTDLHLSLLQSPKQAFYSAAYYQALPFIVELRAKEKQVDNEKPELETCFEAMYGTMMLRLQKRELSKDTQTAVAHISKLLALLADAWNKEREGDLEL